MYCGCAGSVSIAAQPRHAHVDAAVEGVALVALEPADQVVARQHAVRVLGQHAEQFQFGTVAPSTSVPSRSRRRAGRPAQRGRRQSVPLVSPRGGAATCCRRASAPQQGAHPGQQLSRAEGLGQVVVGAHLQAHHAVDLFAARRQHQDGHVRLAQRAARLRPSSPGSMMSSTTRSGMAAAMRWRICSPPLGHVHLVAAEPQVVAQQLTQGRVVVNHQHARLGWGSMAASLSPCLAPAGAVKHSETERHTLPCCRNWHATQDAQASAIESPPCQARSP
jgi:hypothetical protein